MVAIEVNSVRLAGRPRGPSRPLLLICLNLVLFPARGEENGLWYFFFFLCYSCSSFFSPTYSPQSSLCYLVYGSLCVQENEIKGRERERGEIRPVCCVPIMGKVLEAIESKIFFFSTDTQYDDRKMLVGHLDRSLTSGSNSSVSNRSWPIYICLADDDDGRCCITGK